MPKDGLTKIYRCLKYNMPLMVKGDTDWQICSCAQAVTLKLNYQLFCLEIFRWQVWIVLQSTWTFKLKCFCMYQWNCSLKVVLFNKNNDYLGEWTVNIVQLRQPNDVSSELSFSIILVYFSTTGHLQAMGIHWLTERTADPILRQTLHNDLKNAQTDIAQWLEECTQLFSYIS